MTLRHHFDEEAAYAACEFFEMLPHIKGRMAGKPLRLERWQRDDIIRPLFGWKRADGTRTYRTAYIEVPRKNGKSTLCAGIALWMLFCDGEKGAEVYSAAGTRDQALMVFDPACAMIRETDLDDSCKIYKSQKRVVYKNSFYRAVAAEAGAIHGTNPHGIIFDELHVQPDRELWDTFQTGRGERRQPLTVAITTAGYDRSSICWEIHEYARRILDPNDPLEDETFLPVIYAADPEDDWTSPETWKKANPNFGVSIFEDFLSEECAKAKDSPAYENTFRRLYLNQWTEQAVRWMPMHSWDECATEISESDLEGRDCYAAIDLSTSRDLTACALVFPLDNGEYAVIPRFWAPKEASSDRERQDRQSYRGWAERGLVTLTEGNVTDYEQVRYDILQMANRFNIQQMGFDPWNATEFHQALIRDGFSEQRLISVPQTFATFNEPMKRLLELVSSTKLRHDGNPVLRWQAGNLTVKQDPSGNLRPDKGKSGDKIDGIVAMLMALALALREEAVFMTEESAITVL